MTSCDQELCQDASKTREFSAHVAAEIRKSYRLVEMPDYFASGGQVSRHA